MTSTFRSAVTGGRKGLGSCDFRKRQTTAKREEGKEKRIEREFKCVHLLYNFSIPIDDCKPKRDRVTSPNEGSKCVWEGRATEKVCIEMHPHSAGKRKKKTPDSGFSKNFQSNTFSRDCQLPRVAWNNFSSHNELMTRSSWIKVIRGIGKPTSKTTKVEG